MRVPKRLLPVLVLALLAVQPGNALAATSDSCPAGSIPIFNGVVLGAQVKVVAHVPPDLGQVILCFKFDPAAIGGGALVFTANGAKPEVIVGNNPADCTTAIVDLTTPVRARLAVSADLLSVCITFGNATVTVRLKFGPMPPTFEAWRDGTGSLLDIAACFSRLLDDFDTCIHTNARMLKLP